MMPGGAHTSNRVTQIAQPGDEERRQARLKQQVKWQRTTFIVSKPNHVLSFVYSHQLHLFLVNHTHPPGYTAVNVSVYYCDMLVF